MAQVLRITCDAYLQGSSCSLGKQWIKVKTSSTEKPANVQSKFQNPLKEIKEMFPSTSQVIYPSFEEAEVKLLERKTVEVDESSKKFFPGKKINFQKKDRSRKSEAKMSHSSKMSCRMEKFSDLLDLDLKPKTTQTYSVGVEPNQAPVSKGLAQEIEQEEQEEQAEQGRRLEGLEAG